MLHRLQGRSSRSAAALPGLRQSRASVCPGAPQQALSTRQRMELMTKLLTSWDRKDSSMRKPCCVLRSQHPGKAYQNLTAEAGAVLHLFHHRGDPTRLATSHDHLGVLQVRRQAEAHDSSLLKRKCIAEKRFHHRAAMSNCKHLVA